MGRHFSVPLTGTPLDPSASLPAKGGHRKSQAEPTRIGHARSVTTLFPSLLHQGGSGPFKPFPGGRSQSIRMSFWLAAGKAWRDRSSRLTQRTSTAAWGTGVCPFPASSQKKAWSVTRKEV